MKRPFPQKILKDRDKSGLYLFRDSFFYALPTAANKAVNFIMIPILTNVLTSREIGILNLMLLTSGIIFQIFSLGLKSAALRETIYNNVSLRKVINTGTWANICVFGVITILMFIFSDKISSILFGTPEFSPLLNYIILAGFFYQIGDWALVKYRILRKSIKYSILSSSNIIAYSLIVLTWVTVFHGHLKEVIWARFASNLIFLIIALFSIKEIFTPQLEFNLLKSMLMFGVPLVIGTLGYWGMSYADNYLLRYYTDLEQVGIYSIAYKIGSVIMVAVMGVQMAWPMEIYRLARNENAPILFGHKIFQYIVIMGTLSLAISIFSKELLMFLTPEPYWETANIIPLVTFSYFFMGLRYMINIGTNIRGKTYLQTITLLISLFLNIGLNLIWIPEYGCTGAAMATFVSFFALFLSDFGINFFLFKIKLEIFKILLFTIILSVLLKLGTVVCIEYIFLSILLKAIMVITAFAFGLILLAV